MNGYKKARRELHGVLALLAVCKLLLVLTSRFLGPLLYTVLSAFYGESAVKIYSEFGSYGTLAGLLLEVCIFVLCLLVPVALYFAFSGKKYTRTVDSEKPEILSIAYGVGATVVIGNAAAIVGNVLLSALFSLVGMGDKYYAMLEDSTTYPSNFWLVPLFAFVLAVMPAFLEEITVRGIGLSATKKFGTLFTLFFSGFFFAFLHSSWTQIPFAFVLGVVLAYFTLRFKTIWIAVVSHFVFNFNSVIQSLILENGGVYADVYSLVWSFLYFTLMLGFMVAGLIVYGIKKPDLPKSEFNAREKMKALFSSPFLYVFILLTAYLLIYLLIIY